MLFEIGVLEKIHVLEFLFSKVVGLQVFRPATLLKRSSNTVFVPVNIAEFLIIAIFIENIWWMLESGNWKGKGWESRQFH